MSLDAIMKLAQEADRVKRSLRDAILLLCSNGLTFSSELGIDGLIAVTLDKNEVVVLSIKEVLTNERIPNNRNNSLQNDVDHESSQGNRFMRGKKLHNYKPKLHNRGSVLTVDSSVTDKQHDKFDDYNKNSSLQSQSDSAENGEQINLEKGEKEYIAVSKVADCTLSDSEVKNTDQTELNAQQDSLQPFSLEPNLMNTTISVLPQLSEDTNMLVENGEVKKLSGVEDFLPLDLVTKKNGSCAISSNNQYRTENSRKSFVLNEFREDESSLAYDDGHWSDDDVYENEQQSCQSSTDSEHNDMFYNCDQDSSCSVNEPMTSNSLAVGPNVISVLPFKVKEELDEDCELPYSHMDDSPLNLATISGSATSHVSCSNNAAKAADNNTEAGPSSRFGMPLMSLDSRSSWLQSIANYVQSSPVGLQMSSLFPRFDLGSTNSIPTSIGKLNVSIFNIIIIQF